MAKKQNYTYVLTLDSPLWPRKLADELSYAPGIFQTLVSITDLQNDGHSYGDTYAIERRTERPLTKGGDTDVRYPL
jgi:hypothetical protein